jgi:hypothetical protein
MTPVSASTRHGPNLRNPDRSPTLGRFLKQYPLGFDAGDSNFYRYVGNSPTDFDDPYGLEKTDGGITNRGTNVPFDKIGGGKVEINGVKGQVVVSTGVTFINGALKSVENGILLRYHGSNCGQMRIVQTLWREVRVFQGTENKLVDVELDTRAGKYHSTTDPNKPVYKIDNANKSVLYGGPKGSVSGKYTYTLDKPGNLAQWVYVKYYANDATVTKIVSVGHYDWYLFYEGKAVYHVAWTSTSTWEQGQPTSDPVIEVTGGGPNEGPNQQQLDAFKAQNPDYEQQLTHVFKPGK